MVGRCKVINHQNKKKYRSVTSQGGLACHASVPCGVCENKDVDFINWRFASWKNVAIALFNLFLPRACAGCDTPDYILCENCKKALQCWKRAPFARTVCGYRYACGSYSTVVRRSILLWKDHFDIACDKIFGELIGDLVVEVISKFLRSHSCYISEKPIFVIPVPSSKHSSRHRGRKHMLPVANCVAKRLCNSGIRAYVLDIVSMDARITAKSVQTFGFRGRSNRISKAFSIDFKELRKQKFENQREYKAIVLDDIVTTGSTMNSCVSTLQSSGITVLACFSLACVCNKDNRTADYKC
ncbi:ComF family protein [Gardnerella swidsinskii]|uniref:ComF family protein n=1 Tax=Gardnerella swidsinskii TaxID=2792979 RepID=UPI003970B778